MRCYLLLQTAEDPAESCGRVLEREVQDFYSSIDRMDCKKQEQKRLYLKQDPEYKNRKPEIRAEKPVPENQNTHRTGKTSINAMKM